VISQNRRARSAYRVLALSLVLSIVVALFQALPHPAAVDFFQPQPAYAETLSNPKFVSAALMPNGQVGLLYANGDNGVDVSAEIRFSRYTGEHALAPSTQLSTAGPAYPQLATFRGRLVAGYVDTRAANLGKFIVRASDDNGVTWSAEAYLFSGETFNAYTFAPRLVASRDGQTLYFFNATNGTIPQYRSSTDPTLILWSAAAPAGDSSMDIVEGNNCGTEMCQHAHTFGFMETATAGTWIYISKTGLQVGRGTQVGSLGGTNWSLQFNHGGDGGAFADGDSTATTFLDRDGAVVYVRAASKGRFLYHVRSTDGGQSWAPAVWAYIELPLHVIDAPVGLYVPNHTRGEYVWYAGFGGIENAMRVIPLWTGPQPYAESGTIRLFGSAGGDLDANSAYEYNFGDAVRSIGGGGYVTGATDLVIPGRLLDTAFSRTYNSANGFDSGALGPAWTHNYHWWLTDNGAKVTIRRESGRQDKFTRQLDGSYTKEPGVFDTLVKTGATAYTLTSPGQTSYDFVNGRLVKIREPAGNQITLGYSGWNLMVIPQGGTASFSASRFAGAGVEPEKAADGVANQTTGWLPGPYLVGDWWKATWSSPQSLTRVRLWDLGFQNDYFGQGHLEFSDGSTLNYGFLLNDPGPNGEDFRELSFPRKSGITWMKVVTDALGTGWPGLTEVAAYDDESSTPSFISRLNVVTDTVGRRITLGYAADANLALGRTYLRSVEPDAGFPDSGGELTDGITGDSPDYGDRSWHGHLNLAAPLEVTVDLGAAKAVGEVRSYYFQSPNDGVYRPDQVELLTSTDNTNFTSRGSMLAADAIDDPGNRWAYAVSANATARWVRLRITKGSIATWLFSSEIRVSPQGAVQPSAMVGERLVSVTDPIGRKVGYGYDSSGRLTTVVDKLGNAAGQDPSLHTWTYAYDGLSNHISSITDPDGRVAVANTYDGLGRLDTQQDGLLNTTNFDYAGGQVIITDPRLHVSTQTFDARNRLLSQQDTVGANTYTVSYTYDGCGNRDSATDRRGKLTTYTYDCAGNLRQVVAPSLAPPAPGYETNYDYDPANNNLLEVVDARGFVTTHDYDPLTNVLIETQQQITEAPDLVTFAVTKWQYTDLANPGLPTRIISPRGNETGIPNNTYSQVLEYYPTGELLRRTDADGNKMTFTYDGASRQLTMVDPDGNVLGGTPSQHTWTTTYDENDRVTATIDALGRSALSGYDRTGNRTSATDRNGNVTTYVYDAAARLWKVQQKPEPLQQPTLVYTTTVARDGNGNATQVTQDKQGASGAVTVITDYAYDALNRLANFTTHPGTPANLTTSYVLDGNGNTEKRTTGDGLETIYTYDNMSRLMTVSSTGLPQPIGYDYDEINQRITMTDGSTSTYEYDGLGRMTEAVQPNGTLGYGYDLDSNRTRVTYPTVGNVAYVFSPAGRLSSLTDWGSRQSAYTYTPSGLAKTLLVPGGMTTTYGYDNAQRLTSLTNVTGSGTISSHAYTLDGEGNRVALDETVAGITTAAALNAASVQVNTDAGTTLQDHPAIALGGDGTYLIWDDARDGNANIYFSRRDALTGAWSTPNAKVNIDTGTRIQLNPAIAVDFSNNAYAVWQDERNGAGKPDIYYRKRTAAGTWDATDVKVNTDAGGGGGAVQRNVRIAGKGDGTQTAVWVDLRSSQNNIYSSTLSLAGTWLTPNPRVTDNTAALKDFPDVTVGPDGTSYAVWQDRRNGNDDIYFAKLAPGGTSWTTPDANLKISDDPGTAAQRSPRISIDGSGTLTVVFLDDRVTPTQVRAVRKPAVGAWSSSVVVTDAAARPVAPLGFAVRSDGTAQVAWSDTRAGANTNIWISQYSGGVWSVSALLSDDPGTATQSSPTLAYVGSELASAWRDDRGSNGNVRARRTPGDHFAYRYDGLNRLTSVSLLNPESFALDGASNVTNRSGVSETYDAANRLIADGGTTNVWSNADQLDLRGADTFDYDALDRLISSTVGGGARTYQYNGDGVLQSRTGAGATTFLWDAATSPSRLLAQGGDRIIHGLGPLYIIKVDGTTRALARDAGKSVRAEVNASGAVTGSWRYRAYGEINQTSGQAPSILGYAGQLLDPSGLYYMRARWYDPQTARFLTRDPLSGAAALPSSLNGFAYAGASPINFLDPTGLRAARGDESGFAGACDSECRFKLLYIGRTPLSNAPPNMNPCERVTGQCSYQVTGGPTGGAVEVRNNADDFLGFLTGVVGLYAHGSWEHTMTWSSDLIVSTTSVNPLGAMIHHELGHTPQSDELGGWYIPVYLLYGLGETHETHGMERNANARAHLPLDWGGGLPPIGWMPPWTIGYGPMP
jgi:RHS repeat-associated protein